VLAVVSGSGIDLTGLLDSVTWERRFDEFDGLAGGQVAGHACRFVQGRMGSHPLLLQRGRRHAYEGLTYGDTVRSVDVLKELGATRILFTHAVGALDLALRPGNIVALEAALVWPAPRLNLPIRIEPGFVPRQAADDTGVNCFMLGPSYETRAEIAALQRWGGKTVGMSTAPELHRCNQLGLPGGALSVVTNQCGVPEVLDHADVVAASDAASERLLHIIRDTIRA